MPLSSMTGYARADGHLGDTAWTWEVKSVNGKGLDVRCRLPAGWESWDGEIRKRTAAVLRRGNITVMLSVVRNAAAQQVVINQELLDEILGLQAALRGKIKDEPPRFESLLQIRGLIDVAEIEEEPELVEAREAAVLATLDDVLAAASTARRSEGERLEAVLATQLEEVGQLIEAANGLAATQPEAIHDRLKSQVEELLEGTPMLPEERLLQEVAVLASKADIREELDRLSAHKSVAGELLADNEPVGRRLEFLCQEFNREANTLCAKSNDIELTTVGLSLKAVIDQMREQVQNVE